MKTKSRRLVSILSAMVLMIFCAVPAFADDTVVSLTDDNISGFIISSTSQSLQKNFGSTDYAYVTSWRYRNGAYDYMLLVFDSEYKGSSIPDDVLVPSFGAATVFSINDNSFIVNSVFNSVKPFNDQVNIRDTEGFYYQWFNDPATHIVYSNVSLDGLFDIADPNAPPTPFTVDYSPALKTGLVRKGTLVAPGASNDGQEVETNSIAVTVKMTDEFLNASKPISGAFTYSYQFTCFVVPSEYKDSDIKTMSEHAIYTAAQDNLHYLYYENETLDIDDSLSSEPATGELAPVSEQWANATGVSNCFLLERDNNTPLRNVTIDLHNIDFDNHKSDSYNIVVLGHIVRKSEYGWTAYPSYFKSDCSSLALQSTKEYPMNFGSSEEPVTNKNFYEYFSVISDDWSFKDYPKYEPHKVGGVTVGDSPLDFKRTAKGVQDYNMWEQGGTDNTLKPDDFDKYKEQKKLDENFGSVDFGLDSIKSVFDGSSDFFKFLTASIGILPTTFLTVLISFFVVMLAICVVKWVLK